nr:tRNA uridine-5-carboxymethylaminomethyl(34) synthesis GTPase MnmE [Thiohalomonas denitrificans]
MIVSTDTIAAIATPPGRGGVGIVRVSGSLASVIAERVLGRILPARRADYLPFLGPDASILDQGIALFFQNPHSFTGEDVLELQAHGGPVVLDMLLETVVAHGARLARPGEFCQRAFLNNKLDLAQAEAVADLIESGSREAARSALRSLQGEFSQRVYTLVERLIALRINVESAIDFPDEEIDFLAEGEVSAHLRSIRDAVGEVQATARQGRLLREGMTVVLAGRPNAGKSSLLNALAGQESAIVTEIPGTTRDILREQIDIDGMPLHVIDTAGLRDSVDRIEQEGIRRAWAAIEKADRVLLVVDDRLGIEAEERAILEKLPDGLPVTVVCNKVDLSGREVGEGSDALGAEVRACARTGEGIELLRSHLKRVMGYEQAGEGAFMARRRHLEALGAATKHLQHAASRLEEGAGELVAEELRLAQQHLSEITGEFTSDDLLGRIFESFCIGK